FLPLRLGYKSLIRFYLCDFRPRVEANFPARHWLCSPASAPGGGAILYAPNPTAGRFCARPPNPFKEMRLVVATKWTYLIVSVAGFVLASNAFSAEEPAKTAASE